MSGNQKDAVTVHMPSHWPDGDTIHFDPAQVVGCPVIHAFEPIEWVGQIVGATRSDDGLKLELSIADDHLRTMAKRADIVAAPAGVIVRATAHRDGTRTIDEYRLCEVSLVPWIEAGAPTTKAGGPNG